MKRLIPLTVNNWPFHESRNHKNYEVKISEWLVKLQSSHNRLDQVLCLVRNNAARWRELLRRWGEGGRRDVADFTMRRQELLHEAALIRHWRAHIQLANRRRRRRYITRSESVVDAILLVIQFIINISK